MRFGVTSLGAGLTASLLAHLLLIGAVAVPHQRQTVHGETLTVDLVSPDEAPPFNEPSASSEPSPPPSPTPPKEERQPDWSQLQTQQPLPNPQANSGAEAQERRQQPRANQQAQRQQSQQPPQSSQQQSPLQPPPQQAQAQQQAQPQPPTQPPQSVPAPEPPKAELQPDSLAEQGARLAAMLGLPPPGEGSPFGTEADTKANLDSADIAAFKAHLKKCWTLPPGYTESQKVKVLVRAVLRQDGRLASEPEAMEVSPAKLGFPLFQNAKAALKQCQPYTMLPADKFKEWRVLDLNFSPDQMAGG